MDHSHDYDDNLWDELNHQHAQEIEQHQYQRNTQQSPWNQVGRALSQTARIVKNRVSGALQDTIQQRQQQQLYRDSPSSGRYESLSSLRRNNNQRHNARAPTSADIENELGMNIFGTRQQQQMSRNEPLLPSSNGVSPTDDRIRQSQSPNQQQQQQNGNNYMFIQPFRLMPERDGWGAVADLDVFFASLYQYYNHKGYLTLGIKGAVELITLFFTLALSIFLFAYVDWSALSKCHDESSCRANFSDYLVEAPLTGPSTSVTWKAWVLAYSLIFLSYGAFSGWSLWHALQQARESKWFMEEQLGIGERKLQSGAVDWDQDVVAKIVQLQTSGQYRIAIHDDGNELDALIIAQRILRKENFMIALFNNPTLLDLTIPRIPGVTFFSKSLEWSLYFCILNFMFNHKYQIRPAFYLEPASLKRRFFLCGVAHIIFMPFLLFFMMLHFMLQHAYDWKSTKHYLGPREWSLASKWTLREFNELPHLFDRRMEPSYAAAEQYLKLFRQSELMTALGRVLVFVGGSLGAVLFGMAAMNDAILLHVKIADWNLLWYAGVVAGIYSTGKAMIPDQQVNKPTDYTAGHHSNLSREMDHALEQVAKHTHHYPDVWKGRGWDKSTTYKAFTKMFQYKAQLFAMEVASVIVAPYILCVSLPKCADHICDFVLKIRAEVPGAGDVCGYATFDFDTYGDELWEGRTLGKGPQDQEQPLQEQQQQPPPMVTGSLTESIMKTGNVLESTQQFAIPRAREGKMEKSFFSFKAAHPSWNCSESGQDLVNRLEKYQQDENVALSRERQLHIEAAARQLETLARLERERQAQSSNRGAGIVVDGANVDESYMRPVNNNPDAGAGSPGLEHLQQQRRQHENQQQGASHRLSPVAEDYSPTSSPRQDLYPQGPPVSPTSHVSYQSESRAVRSPVAEQQDDNLPPFASPSPPPPGSPWQQASARLPAGAITSTNSISNNIRAPPPSMFLPSAPGPHLSSIATTTNSNTVDRYQHQSSNAFSNSAATNATGNSTALGSVGLSTELRRVLNMSTLDAESVLGDSSMIPPPGASLDPTTLNYLSRSISGLPTVDEERERAAEQQVCLF